MSARLAVARAPLFLLIGTMVFYLGAAVAAAEASAFGMLGMHVHSVSISFPMIDDERAPDPGPALALVATALESAPTSAVLVADRDAGIGIGIYDTQRRWPDLPSELSGGGELLVSFRQGSVMSSLGRQNMQLVGAGRVLPEYATGAAPGDADYVYSLRQAPQISGQLIVDGLSDEVVSKLAERLSGLGYQVEVAGAETFVAGVWRSPVFYVLGAILALAWVTASSAWGMQMLAWRGTLVRQRWVGGSPTRVAALVLPSLLIAWLASAVIGSGLALLLAALASAAGISMWLWGVWGAALLADLLWVLGQGWIHGVQMTRLERG